MSDAPRFTLSAGTQRRFGSDVPVTAVSMRGSRVATIRPLDSGLLLWVTDGSDTPHAAGDAITQAEALEAIAAVLVRAHGPTMLPLEVRRAEERRQRDLFGGDHA